MKKKVFVVICIIVLTILIVSIYIFTYKKSNSGNTIISQSEEDILEYILNINTYKAKIEIEIETNKNTNKYVVYQTVEPNNVCTQEILEPSSIAGVITKYDGNNLKIINNELKLATTFENYSYIVDNSLWLDSFIKDYKKYNNSKSSEEDDEIVLEVKDEESNKYSIYKKLYVDKKTRKPTKMIVQDINKKTLIYILYSKIEIS